MYDKQLTPDEKIAILDSHLRRLAGDAYSNFCISLGLGAQGHVEQAAKHVESMDTLNAAIEALQKERAVVLAEAPSQEVSHDHSHE